MDDKTNVSFYDENQKKEEKLFFETAKKNAVEEKKIVK